MPAPLLLVVTGLPAAGKSTLGGQLARTLRLPFVTKDDYKAIVLARQPDLPRDVAGPLSFDLMWHVAGVTLTAGLDTLLETHFYHGLSEAYILKLAQAHGARLAQVFCHAPLEVLQQRHDARVASGTRPGIDLPLKYAQAPAYWCHAPLDLGPAPCLSLETSQGDPLPSALAWVQGLLQAQPQEG
ncbi:ATP-binding protein [Deinococcus sp. HMF7604]|uniref:AAA family ATPase n=1 Tax=Deinococcus betulae TaxID=2873312 RepID=UPI001CCBFFCD|nr:ATP-binding protein [Deinococcus betulae]MBZ9751857.1 ATP-binding protein [Deinococcus betulae]